VTPTRRRILALAAVLALAALPAAAEIYVVTMANGNTFQSRYQPQEAPWDAGKVLLQTEFGNWISLGRADIASVTTETENKGFGFVIDNTTIALGWAPNDRATPEQEAEAARAAAAAGLQPMGLQESPYTVQQFVEPSQAQGIPGAWIGTYGGGNPATIPGAPGVVVPPAAPPVVVGEPPQ
jgi:hypothetical protein